MSTQSFWMEILQFFLRELFSGQMTEEERNVTWRSGEQGTQTPAVQQQGLDEAAQQFVKGCSWNVHGIAEVEHRQTRWHFVVWRRWGKSGSAKSKEEVTVVEEHCGEKEIKGKDLLLCDYVDSICTCY